MGAGPELHAAGLAYEAKGGTILYLLKIIGPELAAQACDDMQICTVPYEMAGALGAAPSSAVLQTAVSTGFTRLP